MRPDPDALPAQVPVFRVPNPDYRPDPNLRWKSARIPVQMRGRRIDDLTDIPEQVREAAKAFVESFGQRWFDEDTPYDQYPDDRSLIGRGLTLIGPFRHGKTALACAIMTEVALAYPEASIRFVGYADYVHAFTERHTLARLGTTEAEEELTGTQVSIDRVFKSALVTLDDVGHEHSTASRTGADELERLIRSRHRRGLPTILTSNLLASEWAHAYSPAMSAFLSHELPPLVVNSGRELEERGR